ncbi:MAG: beta strand repeat-containing protein, partial [bacterium JZ-2024 1]
GGSGGTLGGSAGQGNDITGATGSAHPTDSYAVYVDNSSPTISNNTPSLNGGQGTNTYGLYITNGSDPVVQSNTIDGGTATGLSVGIFNDSAAWDDDSGADATTDNTISGGTCTGCDSYGIYLNAGTPTIGPNNSISGGTAFYTPGIYVTGTANPTITNNASITGGTATPGLSIGIYGGTSSWNSTVSGNTISGGTTCRDCISYGIYLNAGTPTIGSNSIDGGTAGGTAGIYVVGTANPTITNNPSITGGTAFPLSSLGIYGGTSSWTGTVSGNTISGGTCPGCSSYGIFLINSTPTIGPSNNIDGGTGGLTYGIYVYLGANPTITGNTSINGGTATSESIGIFGNISSWTGTVSDNTISGGTCTGCRSFGIRLDAGTPTIGPSNNIDGGTGATTRGIYVYLTASPTITGNASINGGTATSQSAGIYGNASSWNSTVSGNTISGGTCTGCVSLGIYLDDGTPTIGSNTSISGGSGAHTRGIYLDGTANPTITNNPSITGGTATPGSCAGIYGASSSWNSTVSGNTISGGTCPGSISYGIYLSAGTPTIGPSNNIDGGTGLFGVGIYLDGTANPTITGNPSINGGTPIQESAGIYGASSSWNSTVSGNTISGGNCTGFFCYSYGISLGDGTPTIGSNNSISGGTGDRSFGIAVDGTANPTITGNTSISGGTAGTRSLGIYGTASSWNSTVSDNTISGGTCAGCGSYGIFLGDGTPTIGSNNSITGGSGAFTRGIYLTGSASPVISTNNSINGGNATSESIGIRGNTSSWSGTVSGNTISGGTCTASGCNTYGIYVSAGTPPIFSNISISGGSAAFTRGIYVTGSANTVISENNDINGGNAISESIGILGDTSSWTQTGPVIGNTISGGTCTASGCNTYGITLLAGMPPITGNTITAGTATNAWGVWIGSPPWDFGNNTISGGTGSGFDVEDARPAGFACILAIGTKTTNAPGNTSPDDNGMDIGDSDGGATDGKVDGPFTFGTELKIQNSGNCLFAIDTGA